MNDPLVILPVPGDDPGAFPLELVRAAQKRWRQLGFGVRPERDLLNSGVSERLLDSKQLGELLGCDATTCEAMARDGRLPSIRIGRLLRFEASVCKARLRVTDGGPV